VVGLKLELAVADPKGADGGSGQQDRRLVVAKARWRIHERATSSGRRL
jgi:hypothetical protein